MPILKEPYTPLNYTEDPRYGYWDETPEQANFEYVQWRTDPNLDNYDVQFYVIDPAFDPMAAVTEWDRKTHVGVIEVYDGNYLHQDRVEYPRRQQFKRSEAKVDGHHHYEATR